MQTGLGILTLWVTAYILGAIPTALIIMYLLTGKDLRRYGDGSLKYTNVWRILGPEVTGIAVLGEMIKGIVVVNTLKLTPLAPAWSESLIFFGVLGLMFPFRKNYGQVSPMPFVLGGIYWLKPEIAQIAVALGFAMLLIYKKAYLANKAVALAVVVGYALLTTQECSLIWGIGCGLVIFCNVQCRQKPQLHTEMENGVGTF